MIWGLPHWCDSDMTRRNLDGKKQVFVLVLISSSALIFWHLFVLIFLYSLFALWFQSFIRNIFARRERNGRKSNKGSLDFPGECYEIPASMEHIHVMYISLFKLSLRRGDRICLWYKNPYRNVPFCFTDNMPVALSRKWHILFFFFFVWKYIFEILIQNCKMLETERALLRRKI